MQDIFYTYYKSPLGLLKIGATEDYVTQVTFHNTGEQTDAASRHMPNMLIDCVEQLIQYFNGERRQFELVLNQPGTPFQQDVWNMLTQIGYGKTISYLELARRSGDTKATRAVANANGRNDIAVIVPCHRVIGSNKDLVGYAGGLWRKKWLLELEAKVAHGVQTLF